MQKEAKQSTVPLCKMKFTKQKWTQIVIQDPDFLSGTSISSIFSLLTDGLKFKYVIINDIEGSGKDWLIDSLQKKENKICSVEEIKQSLVDVKQLDWGDFFLFNKQPSNWENPRDGYYPFLIQQAQTLMRTVDNQYFYIYSPYDEVVQLIQKKYIVEEFKKDILEKLDYPY